MNNKLNKSNIVYGDINNNGCINIIAGDDFDSTKNNKEKIATYTPVPILKNILTRLICYRFYNNFMICKFYL